MRKGGWINGSRADDNQRIMSSDSFGEEAGHNAIISRPFLFPSYWCVSDSVDLMTAVRLVQLVHQTESLHQ
jgi:hypothetical protein